MLLAFTSWQASSRMSLGMSAIVLPAAMRQTLQHTHTHIATHIHRAVSSETQAHVERLQEAAGTCCGMAGQHARTLGQAQVDVG